MGKPDRYSAAVKILHWVNVTLLIGQYIVAWTMPHIGRNTPVTALIGLHFSFGIMIRLVAIVRLAWRATHGEPAPLDGGPPWQMQSAGVVHWLLYVLLFVVPILGWISASWRGMPLVLFGARMPKLIAMRAPGWGCTAAVHLSVA